ncbi:MAG: type II/IV secretion system protein [Magnetococcales bacterium]|nr:type II/IV secretion system protein [Magnetococcales bacterium]
MPIGRILVHQGLLSEEQVAGVLHYQQKHRCKFGQALRELALLGEEEFLPVLARQLQLRLLTASDLIQVRASAHLLAENHARRLQALVVEVSPSQALVALTDPTDLFVYDELVRLLGRPVRPALVASTLLQQGLERAYQGGQALDGDVAALVKEVERLEGPDSSLTMQSPADIPVARLLQGLLEEAVARGASDIHIEPDQEILRIRLRVDGVLQERLIREGQIAPALISKLKLMAGLEISERRLPQDGRLRITILQKNLDIRLATLPVQDGESVVLRLLDQSASHLQLAGTGLPDGVVRGLRLLARHGHGLILVTGPTGSGKTTTLYGLLSEINQPGVKIITVEDPVEYRLSRVNQVQVNPKIHLTFAQVLRHVLRQDPDVILVGEMRDGETAETAVTAAMTGHLVLSTLHTRDAVGSITRMLDLGIPGYGLAATLLGVLSQRLIRRLCPDCTIPWRGDGEELALPPHLLDLSSGSWKTARGCPQCASSGYRGRIAVAELLTMTPELASSLRHNDLQTFTTLAGPGGLWQHGLQLARQGVTSLAEITRLAPMTVGGGGYG